MIYDTQNLPGETEQHNTSLLNQCVAEHPQCNFEKLKTHYFKTAYKNPLAMEYTLSEIENIDRHLEKIKKLYKGARYYTLGYDSVMKNNYPHLQSDSQLNTHILSYATGIADAHYKGFLRQQLHKLKAGESLDIPVIDAPSHTISFVRKFLDELQQAFNTPADYESAVNAVTGYFVSGKTNTQPLFVKNGNIKKLAFALGQVWRSQRNDVITYEYLNFYKNLFSVFKNQKLGRKNLQGTPLYKYSLSQT
jgi:hypothetical protein